MKKIMGRLLVYLLVVTMAFPWADISAAAKTETGSEKDDSSKIVRGTIDVSDINKDGDIKLSITKENLYKSGYKVGDTVKVKILGKRYVLPVVSDRAYVGPGEPAILYSSDKIEDANIYLVLNNGDFATAYGIAARTDGKNGSFKWNYEEGITGPVKISIWMKKKGGYYIKYGLQRSYRPDERDVYNKFTDEEFANFRMVSTSGIGYGILYRTSSPLDPRNKRNAYADKALKDAGVSVIVNLSDEEDQVKKYEGFSETYYSTADYTALGMDLDYSSKKFRQKLCEGLRFMADNPGIYAVCCSDGKDLTGYVAAILECLMGAGYDEVIKDYMLSFYNYFGMTEKSAVYEYIAKRCIEKALIKAFRFTKEDTEKDLSDRDLKACAYEYLRHIGLTKEEIERLKENLSEGVPFVEKEVPFINKGIESGIIRLRFYRDQPNIPYIGLKEFSEYRNINPLKCEKDGSGKLVFTNSLGYKAVADVKAGTLSSDDWAHFRNAPLPYEGDSKALKDSSCNFVRITELVYEGECSPVTFDMKKYGLKMYEYEDDLFMSFSLIASLFAEISTYNMYWNGKGVYSVTYELSEQDIVELVQNSPIFTKIMATLERPKDIADETYKELCFNYDYYYGHPGSAALDAEIKEKGLHRALLDLGKDGRSIIKGLKSTEALKYYPAAEKLYYKYLDDGHTFMLEELRVISLSVDIFTGYSPKVREQIQNLKKNSKNSGLYSLYSQIKEKREEIWGKESYFEYGNTAIIRLKDFLSDDESWEKFYNGEGDIPTDSPGIVLTGLRKAKNNPEIKNILFDLSVNNGGEGDTLAFIMNLITGQQFRMKFFDRINNQVFACVYEADTNLDGIFDERDKEELYDRFNYGVLTSKSDFSMGNAFPVIMQEAGAVLIGEPTAGGTCSVQFGIQPDGSRYVMSSALAVFVDRDGEIIEDGCTTDISIDHKESVTGKGIIYDYSAYFDAEYLNELMNSWFSA